MVASMSKVPHIQSPWTAEPAIALTQWLVCALKERFNGGNGDIMKRIEMCFYVLPIELILKDAKANFPLHGVASTAICLDVADSFLQLMRAIVLPIGAVADATVVTDGRTMPVSMFGNFPKRSNASC